jgi:hypothetical protein
MVDEGFRVPLQVSDCGGGGGTKCLVKNENRLLVQISIRSVMRDLRFLCK